MSLNITIHICNNKFTNGNRQTQYFDTSAHFQQGCIKKKKNERGKVVLVTSLHTVQLMQHLRPKWKGQKLPGVTLEEYRLSLHIWFKNSNP